MPLFPHTKTSFVTTYNTVSSIWRLIQTLISRECSMASNMVVIRLLPRTAWRRPLLFWLTMPTSKRRTLLSNCGRKQPHRSYGLALPPPTMSQICAKACSLVHGKRLMVGRHFVSINIAGLLLTVTRNITHWRRQSILGVGRQGARCNWRYSKCTGKQRRWHGAQCNTKCRKEVWHHSQIQEGIQDLCPPTSRLPSMHMCKPGTHVISLSTRCLCGEV